MKKEKKVSYQAEEVFRCQIRVRDDKVFYTSEFGLEKEPSKLNVSAILIVVG